LSEPRRDLELLGNILPRLTETYRARCSDCAQDFWVKGYVLTVWGMARQAPKCPACTRAAAPASQARRLEEVARTKQKWLARCGVPARFRGKTFDSWDYSRFGEKVALLKQYVEEFPMPNEDAIYSNYSRGYPSMLLYGPPGVGKTHLVCAVAQRLIDRWQGQDINCPVTVISEPELLREIQATYNQPFSERSDLNSEQGILSSLTRVPLLILDDLSKEERGDVSFRHRILFALIDGRYRRDLPMIVTTNRLPVRLRAYLRSSEGEDAIYDRLVEMTGSKFVELSAESYRREIMNTNQFVIERVRSRSSLTEITLQGGLEVQLRPFAYVKQNDILEFVPSVEDYKDVYKVFQDRATGEMKKIRLHPPYRRNEIVYVPPHQFEVTFREMIKIDKKDDFYASALKTTEGVGEILYGSVPNVVEKGIGMS